MDNLLERGAKGFYLVGSAGSLGDGGRFYQDYSQGLRSEGTYVKERGGSAGCQAAGVVGCSGARMRALRNSGFRTESLGKGKGVPHNGR